MKYVFTIIIIGTLNYSTAQKFNIDIRTGLTHIYTENVIKSFGRLTTLGPRTGFKLGTGLSYKIKKKIFIDCEAGYELSGGRENRFGGNPPRITNTGPLYNVNQLYVHLGMSYDLNTWFGLKATLGEVYEINPFFKNREINQFLAISKISVLFRIKHLTIEPFYVNHFMPYVISHSDHYYHVYGIGLNYRVKLF